MEQVSFVINVQPSIIVRAYRTDKMQDICWRYEQADISYKMAVMEVKVQCALNQGLAEHKLYEALKQRGNRLPMAQTRILTENTRLERVETKKTQVVNEFHNAKHLRRQK